jgi:tripartite-type tricarboxylate transporter receptor subunit TctC
MLALAGVGACTSIAPAIARASWPTRPVRLVVPCPPGQAADIFARLLAERLAALWQQQVIVENKAGASGIAGTDYGKAAAPDGYTLMVVTSGTFGVNPTLFPDLPYKPLLDFLPITNIVLMPLVLVAHPSLPAGTIGELIELARREPGRLSYASAGPGTAQHLAMELLKLRARLDIVRVPYKGSARAMAGLLGGHVKLMMDKASSALAPIAERRIKALAITTIERAAPPLEAIPPIADTLPGFNAAGWAGLAAPAHTPLEIVAKVSNDVQETLMEADMRRQIELHAALPAPGSPIQFADFIKKEIDTWGEVVRATGTKPAN